MEKAEEAKKHYSVRSQINYLSIDGECRGTKKTPCCTMVSNGFLCEKTPQNARYHPYLEIINLTKVNSFIYSLQCIHTFPHLQ